MKILVGYPFQEKQKIGLNYRLHYASVRPRYKNTQICAEDQENCEQSQVHCRCVVQTRNHYLHQFYDSLKKYSIHVSLALLNQIIGLTFRSIFPGFIRSVELFQLNLALINISIMRRIDPLKICDVLTRINYFFFLGLKEKLKHFRKKFVICSSRLRSVWCHK
jgi:hypothetical protein